MKNTSSDPENIKFQYDLSTGSSSWQTTLDWPDLNRLEALIFSNVSPPDKVSPNNCHVYFYCQVCFPTGRSQSLCLFEGLLKKCSWMCGTPAVWDAVLHASRLAQSISCRVFVFSPHTSFSPDRRCIHSQMKYFSL
jgi:hypothetical protein